MIDIRSFTSTEIGEINSYIINQVPQSILPSLFILTEEPVKKTKAFNIIFRILSAARDFVENNNTKDKLTTLLDQYKKNYEDLYYLYLSLESNSYNSKKIENKIVNYYRQVEDNNKVSKFINLFLVFAEKQELLEVEKVTGLDLSKPEGEDLYKKLTAEAN